MASLRWQVAALAGTVSLLGLAACASEDATAPKPKPAASVSAVAPSAAGLPASAATASGTAPAATASGTAPASTSPPRTESSATAAASGSASAADAESCAAGMVLVEGNYCPSVQQKCLEHHDEWRKERARVERARAAGKKASTSASERCLRYQQPSRCLSKKRRPLRFCMDRYEWPNQKGELPKFLVSWHDAVKACKEVGKRLCTVAEFNFACEGEAMLPYTYGYERDASKCAIDKAYIRRNRNLKRYDSCMRDPLCKAEIERLDQREPAGARAECVSPFGVYDLNGNINEWVERPGKKPPDRSGLKSGWWGPVRGRCRPTVGFHKEGDYGYEVGFRCCADAAAE